MNVLLVEDHPLFQHALSTLLTSRIGADAVEILDSVAALTEWLAAGNCTDLVVLDRYLIDGDALPLVATIHEKGFRLVMVTGEEDVEEMLAAIKQGADAYVLKTASPDDIVQAITASLQGQQRVVPVKIMEWLHQANTTEKGVEEAIDADAGPLSRRELRIATLAAEGLSNPEIAEKLGLSRYTVRNHLGKIMRKLDVRNRTELAAKLS